MENVALVLLICLLWALIFELMDIHSSCFVVMQSWKQDVGFFQFVVLIAIWNSLSSDVVSSVTVDHFMFMLHAELGDLLFSYVD